MAILAIRKARMIKPRVFPVEGVVAIGALPVIMIVRIVIRQVAGLAIGEANVIKGSVFPVAGVGVAIRTCTGIWVKGEPLQPVCIALR